MSADSRSELHIHVHLDPITVAFAAPARKSGEAVTAILAIGGNISMPTQISIDDANRTAQLYWVDDKGDTDAPRPDGALVTFTTANPAGASAAADPDNPDLAHITPLAEGDNQLQANITDSAGNPLMEPDGVTPFTAQPAPFTVVAGQATGAGLGIKS